ncbi:serine/threonine-protein kinase [Streptomyces sp. MP131-18]|uniref:serine/threonine-protein kinase n=1 Tax=Streptomyces sp. MP131-18 TaxID=1857892 RepID=UPI00097BF7CD|nr:Serine/threonine-protein kinase AfsK [Streptomyces sp. MP131-18]
MAESGPSAAGRLGGYALERRLGAGGMGVVYLARSATGRRVALKVIRPEYAEDAEFRDRFRREVAAVRMVSGAFTASVVDADTEGSPPWLATQYVPGDSLAERVRRDGPLPLPEAVRLAAQLAEALSDIHRQGIVHRDLKPGNILLADDGIRVIDFGISRPVGAGRHLTRTGSVMGTPAFMAPEQLDGPHHVGRATDVFALGSVLAFAFLGRSPFEDRDAAGAEPIAAAYAVVHREPDVHAVPEVLRPLVAACLAKDPRHRPALPEVLRSAVAAGAGRVPEPRRTGERRAAARAFPLPRRPPPATEPGLAALADQLAVAVRRQWETEAGVRGLNDPRPLTVAWRPAPERLVEEWDWLRRLADDWGPGSGTADSGCASGPGDLAGSGGQILHVFRERVPTRRLVVLGAPGSGKTMLLVRLLLDLIEHRHRGAAVPVLFTLSSWDPAELDLESWLTHRLTQDFKELAATGGAALGGISRARALLMHRLVLPLLDGFDELPAQARGAALDQINRAVPQGQSVILSSRTREYSEAVRPAAGLPHKLVGAAGIELLPLDPQEISSYLLRDAGGTGTPTAARWDSVVHSLKQGGPVAEALSTPLMIFLARTIYNPRTGEPLDAARSPAELLENPALSSRAAVEAHLFEAFVPAAYRRHPAAPSHWSAAEAGRTLRWLARHAERVRAGATDLAWWQLRRAVPRWLLPVLLGVLAGALETAVTWLTMQVSAYGPFWGDRHGDGGLTWSQASLDGLFAGLVGGVTGRIGGGLIGASIGAAGVVIGHGDPLGAWTCQVLTAGLVYGFVGGLGGELTAGLAARRAGGERPRAAGRRPWSRGAALLGAGIGGCYGCAQGMPAMAVGLACVFALIGGLAVGHGPGPEEVPPAADLRWSWDWAGLWIGLGGGLAVTLPTWLIGFSEYGISHGLAADVAGVTLASHFGTIHATGALTANCLGCAIMYGIRGATADLTLAPAPAALLARDRRTFRRLGCVTAGVIGLALGLVFWCSNSIRLAPATTGEVRWQDLELAPTLPGLVGGLFTGALLGAVVGLAVAWQQTACGPFTITRIHLALCHRLPRRLMAFLADAHERRGVLRQSGAVYQLRHIELQRHLAAGDHGRPDP